MEEIRIISKSTFLDKEIDVWGSFEKPLFRATDVADWIQHSDVSTMVRLVDEDEKVFETNPNNVCGGQGVWFLTEDGVYEILMRSRKRIAKQFKKGVKKILHDIRTKGGYLVTTQNDTPATILARAMKVADEVIAEHEKRIKELEEQGRQQELAIEQKDVQIEMQDRQIKVAAPKVDYYDNTLASTTCITTTQVADDLHITARSLNAKLKELGIIYSQSGQWHLRMPYKGWNLSSTRTYNYQSINGDVSTKVTLVWNQRGKRFILALYNNDFNIKAAIAEINGEKVAQSANNQSNNL